MGGDGGSIPKRGDIVKTKGYGFKRNLGGMGYMPNLQVKIPQRENSAKIIMHEKWTKCSLTNEPLNPPVVICKKGFLYNKEAIINKLLRKSKSIPHIQRLSDIFDIKVRNPALLYV
ncbi:Replication termination factor 2 [Cryptosporidium felis]|nr:Replication termination factor 2 [Cryptosporidium felis]